LLLLGRLFLSCWDALFLTFRTTFFSTFRATFFQPFGPLFSTSGVNFFAHLGVALGHTLWVRFFLTFGAHVWGQFQAASEAQEPSPPIPLRRIFRAPFFRVRAATVEAKIVVPV
jgi:hypothetical protein